MVQKKGLHFKVFISLLVIVVVLSCILVGTVLAWLERDYTYNSSGLNLGKIELGIYADGSLISGTVTNHDNGSTWECSNPYAIPSGSATRNLNLKVRNLGNIDALVRATIRVYILDDDDRQITLLLGSTPSVVGQTGTTQPNTPIIKVAMDTSGWVTDFPENNQIAAGYMYLNSKLLPYNTNGTNVTANEIPIVTSIRVPTGYESTPIYVSVTLDAISWAGNIYRKISQLCADDYMSYDTDRNYYVFTEPVGYNTEIPVKAFPFGKTLPMSWRVWQ